jgi:hypothetical protein
MANKLTKLCCKKLKDSLQGLAKTDFEAQIKFVAQIFGIVARTTLTTQELLSSKSFATKPELKPHFKD